MDISIFDKMNVEDTACKDTIELLIEQLNEEDNDYMIILVSLKEKLEVTWNQPWYQKTGWLTKKIEQTENEENEFRRDKFSLTECEHVHRNWLKFVKIPNKPICLARWTNKKKPNKFGPEEYVRRYIITYLARGLHRNLHQVFQHFKACYGATKKGPYTKLETKIIRMCYYHFPKNATIIASQILSREARGIQVKLTVKDQTCGDQSHQYLTDSSEKKRCKVKWNLDMATKLLKLIMKYTELPLNELKYKKIDSIIWVNIEVDMDKSAKLLSNFWYYSLHVQIFVKCDLNMAKIKKKLIKIIRAHPYRIWTDINWKDLVQHFPDGVTSQFLYNVGVNSARPYKHYLKAPLNNVLDFMNANIKNSPNKRLRTITLNKDGMLEVVRY